MTDLPESKRAAARAVSLILVAICALGLIDVLTGAVELAVVAITSSAPPLTFRAVLAVLRAIGEAGVVSLALRFALRPTASTIGQSRALGLGIALVPGTLILAATATALAQATTMLVGRAGTEQLAAYATEGIAFNLVGLAVRVTVVAMAAAYALFAWSRAR